ncbi:MAG: hypothetical protein WCR72_16530 [Bacteroidota bacterium]
MILAILNFITDSSKTAVTSVASVFVGQAAYEGRINMANIALQHAAWTIAILTGLLTIINLFYPLRSIYDKRKQRRKYRQR